MVPFDKATDKAPLAFRADPHGRRAEAFRHLRTNLQFIDIDRQPRIIAITSSISGEGRSTTAVNLAAGLAEAGFRVCLIEADLRRPTLGQTLGLVSEAGLTSVLVGKAAVEYVVHNAGQNLMVLTAGVIPPNPSELLASQHARAVIQEIAAQVDYTIIDTAPLLPVADGARSRRWPTRRCWSFVPVTLAAIRSPDRSRQSKKSASRCRVSCSTWHR